MGICDAKDCGKETEETGRICLCKEHRKMIDDNEAIMTFK